MRSIMESVRLKLEVLTPVCVSDGKQLNWGLDLICDARDRFVYRLNVDKLAQFMYERGINDINRAIQTHIRYYPEKFSLYRMNLMGLSEKRLKEQRGKANYRIDPEHILSHIKDSKGMAYIPASTIKGLIRTALAYKVLKEDPSPIVRHIKTILDALLSRKLRSSKSQRRLRKTINVKNAANYLEKEIFKLETHIRGFLFDLCRNLMIEDPAERSPLELRQVLILKRSNRGWNPFLVTSWESLPPGTVMEYQLKILKGDPLIAKGKGEKEVSDFRSRYLTKLHELLEDGDAISVLKSILREWSNDLVVHEIERMKDVAPDFARDLESRLREGELLLRIGRFCGHMFKTIDLILYNNPQLRSEYDRLCTILSDKKRWDLLTLKVDYLSYLHSQTQEVGWISLKLS